MLTDVATNKTHCEEEASTNLGYTTKYESKMEVLNRATQNRRRTSRLAATRFI